MLFLECAIERLMHNVLIFINMQNKSEHFIYFYDHLAVNKNF